MLYSLSLEIWHQFAIVSSPNISLSAFCYYTSKMDTMCIDISNRKVDTIYLEGRKTFLMESHLSRVFHSEVN